MATSTYTFKNGFKLVYQKADSSIQTTSIIVFVKFGSIHERLHGAAHFIEHMCFKGTDSKKTSKDITTPYDKIGAFLNASTYKEYTDYIVKCEDVYVANCVDVLSDMVLHSTFTTKNSNLEKNVVKEETIRLDDDPEHHIYKMTESLLYSMTPYANPIDDISYHTSKNPLPNSGIIDDYHQFYQPYNMGISIVSNLSFETIKSMVSKTHFTKKPSHIQSIPRHIYTIASPPDLQLNIQRKKGIYATHLSISFRICEYGHPDMYRLQILSNILAGYMSSRMFTLLREKHGVTYKSSCMVNCYQPTGQLSIYTMCDPTKMMRNKDNAGVLTLLIHMLLDLLKNGVTHKEVRQAIGNLKGKTTRSLEDPHNTCVHNGLEQIVYENPHSIPYKQLYHIYYEKITKKSINEMIKKYITRENMVVCLLGENVPSRDSVLDIIEHI
jgi:predicted Zn-dependent peptidase